jgi:hypothetical protein
MRCEHGHHHCCSRDSRGSASLEPLVGAALHIMRTCTLTKPWFLLAATAFIALISTLLYFGLQDREVNDFHPPERSLWLAYYWIAETPFGSFGLENWRLEGINTHTAVHFAKYSYYDIPLSAPAVAAIGFAASNTFALLCIASWSICQSVMSTQRPAEELKAKDACEQKSRDVHAFT